MIKPLHALLLLLVAFIWGTNFVVMRWALDDFPPFLLASLRYLFTFFPICFFIARPKIASKWLILGGLGYASHFGLMFTALKIGFPPGLSSIIIQFQVFLTIGLSYFFFVEKISLKSLCAMSIAIAGLTIIALHIDGEITSLGISLMLLAALCWAFGNVFLKMTKKAEPQSFSMLGYVVWASLYAALMLLPFALIFEPIQASLLQATLKGWASMLWQSVGNSLLGYTLWSVMLMRYSAALVTPFALLVPVFGMASSYLLLNEALPDWKVYAAGCLILGLAINSFNFAKK